MDPTVYYDLKHFNEYNETPVQRAKILRGHKKTVYCCAWNPKRDLLATGSADNTARIWNLDDRSRCNVEQVLKHNWPAELAESDMKELTALDWSNDGQFLATADFEGNARIWSAIGTLLNDSLHQHTAPIFRIKWNKRGDHLVTASGDKSTIIWDTATGNCAQQFAFHSAQVLDIDWRTNVSFASCSRDLDIHVCKLGFDHPYRTFMGHTDDINAIKWDPQGKLLASCSDDKTVKMWTMEQSNCVHNLKAHSKDIYTIMWSPTGPGTANPNMPLILASASVDLTIRLWDVEMGNNVHSLTGHSEAVYSLAFSPDALYLASCSFDSNVFIWSTQTGQLVHSYRTQDVIYDVAWNSRGNKVAACSADGTVSVLDMRKLGLVIRL